MKFVWSEKEGERIEANKTHKHIANTLGKKTDELQWYNSSNRNSNVEGIRLKYKKQGKKHSTFYNVFYSKLNIK